MTDVYYGDSFNVAREERAWTTWSLWRITDDEGVREQLVLSQQGMDELCDYFHSFYLDDRTRAVLRGEEGLPS